MTEFFDDFDAPASGPEAEEPSGPVGRILVVDDDAVVRETLRIVLEGDFDVSVADSGEACLAAVSESPPDLVLMDIEMPGIDGYETCRRLRADHVMPVLFVSSHDTLEERLKAYDAGGDDFVSKPFDGDLLLRKAKRVVAIHAERTRLAQEKSSLHQMAMGFLKNMGETGVLLDFIRKGIACLEYEELARKLVQSMAEYGLPCHVQVRHNGTSRTFTPHGEATPLEASIVDKCADLGRIFQFSRRMIINYDLVSILILNLPDDAEEVGRIRDNVAILAESAEAIAETIGIRKSAAAQAEALQTASRDSYHAIAELRELYRTQQAQTRVLMQELIEGVEKTYVFLGLTDRQEDTLSQTVRHSAEAVLRLFDLALEFDKRFDRILASLSAPKSGA